MREQGEEENKGTRSTRGRKFAVYHIYVCRCKRESRSCLTPSASRPHKTQSMPISQYPRAKTNIQKIKKRTVTHSLKHRSTSRLYMLSCVRVSVCLCGESMHVIPSLRPPLHTTALLPFSPPLPYRAHTHSNESLTWSSSKVRINSWRWCGGMF